MNRRSSDQIVLNSIHGICQLFHTEVNLMFRFIYLNHLLFSPNQIKVLKSIPQLQTRVGGEAPWLINLSMVVGAPPSFSRRDCLESDAIL